MKLTRNLLFLCTLFSLKSYAQLSGTVTVPGTYSSIASVISDLNAQDVNGPLYIDISAGHTETERFIIQ